VIIFLGHWGIHVLIKRKTWRVTVYYCKQEVKNKHIHLLHSRVLVATAKMMFNQPTGGTDPIFSSKWRRNQHTKMVNFTLHFVVDAPIRDVTLALCSARYVHVNGFSNQQFSDKRSFPA